MKVATGNYFNIFSEAGWDNYDLKLKFDIMIIFPEHFELVSDIVDTLELMLEARLRGLGMEKPFARKDDVRDAVIKTLDALGYEYERILVNQAMSCGKLMEVI